MRFRKNETLNQLFAIVGVVCAITPFEFSSTHIKLGLDLAILSLSGFFIMLFVLELATKGGLFRDYVYCDKHGIRIVTRKETYDLPWEDIEMLRLAHGPRGNFGWVIHLYSQEAIFIEVVTKKFIKYVKKIAPDVKIQERK